MNKSLSKLVRIWSILLFLALPAAAQQEMSLEEALRIAHSDSYRLQAANEAVEVAAAKVRVAKADLLPTLSAVATSVDYDGDVFYARFVNPAQPGVPNPNAEPTDVGSFSATRIGALRLSQTLYAGGALRSRVRASRIERQLAEEDERDKRADLDYEVTKAYYDVLLAERAVDVARQSVGRSQETVETVARRRAAEEALEVEELGAASQLAADRHRLLAAENDLRFARLELDRLLARPAGEELRLTDPLERPPRELVEEKAVRAALARHPEVIRGELRRKLAEEQAAGARAHFKPKLELEGYYARIDSETFFKGSTYGFDLKLAIPFLREAAAGRGARAAAAAGRELAESAYQEASSSIGLLARQAVRQVDEAYGAIEVARQALDYQREKHRVTAAAFREKLATADELMSENAALAEAELQLYGAFHQARLREAELDRIAPAAGGEE